MTFREFTSTQVCQEYLEPKPFKSGTKGRFSLVFPEMEFVYFEHWDFTHHVYFKNADKLAELREQVEKHDVYILEED